MKPSDWFGVFLRIAGLVILLHVLWSLSEILVAAYTGSMPLISFLGRPVLVRFVLEWIVAGWLLRGGWPLSKVAYKE